MNRERLLRVADAIEKHEIEWLGFNMQTFGGADDLDRSEHNCETVACIGGWAEALRRREAGEPLTARTFASRDWSVRDKAQDWLELTDGDAKKLFALGSHDFDLVEHVTPVQAVTVLRHAAKTGEIDWSVALGDEG